MQKRNINKKLNKINGTLSNDGQMAVILPSDIAHLMIKKGEARQHE